MSSCPFRAFLSLVTLGLLSLAAFGVLILGAGASAQANDQTPELKFEWIDEDGTVVPTDWQSQTAWVWTDQKLALQIWFEVPNHLTPTLPTPLTKKIAAPQTKAPFKMSPDHVLIVMQLEKPVELFRFEDGRNRFLRISTVSTKTNWMRHASCKEASPYLEEVENTGVGPFFIALNCRGRSSDDTAWIDINASNEVSVEIEAIGKAKQKSNSVLMSMPAPGSKFVDKKLAVIRFRDANGEVGAIYNLNANPTPPVAVPVTEASEPITEPTQTPPSTLKTLRARAGLHAQFIRSGEAQDGQNKMGLTAAEVALSLQATSRRFSADLELPVRRMGTGLDAGSPADTLSWLFLGWKPVPDEDASHVVQFAYGAQSTLLDSRRDVGSDTGRRQRERVSIVSISPAVEATIARHFTLVLAPYDFRSELASVRGRAIVPFSKEGRYAFAIEGYGARSFGQGHDGWYMTGFTLGFTGGF